MGKKIIKTIIEEEEVTVDDLSTEAYEEFCAELIEDTTVGVYGDQIYISSMDADHAKYIDIVKIFTEVTNTTFVPLDKSDTILAAKTAAALLEAHRIITAFLIKYGGEDCANNS